LVLATAALLLPLDAYGKGTVTRTVTTVSGIQLAEQAIGQLRGVQVGSTSATVTLGVGAETSPVRFDFGDVANAVEARPGGWLTFAAVPMLGAAAIRFLNFLAKLGAR
jgi:hypothetical protein